MGFELLKLSALDTTGANWKCRSVKQLELLTRIQADANLTSGHFQVAMTENQVRSQSFAGLWVGSPRLKISQ